jgi:RNA polymerase sigma-70 factor, ECF subfamily
MGHENEQFEAFYRRNYRNVYWYFRRARIADDEAHELTQEVFMKAWQARDMYREEAQRSYLEKIALRVLLTRKRAFETRKRQMQYESADEPAIAAKLVQPAVDVEDLLQRRELREMIERLPPITKQCVLYRIDGFSYDEIAPMVQISVEAVRTRLRDARDILKEDYDDQQK